MNPKGLYLEKTGDVHYYLGDHGSEWWTFNRGRSKWKSWQGDISGESTNPLYEEPLVLPEEYLT